MYKGQYAGELLCWVYNNFDILMFLSKEVFRESLSLGNKAGDKIGVILEKDGYMTEYRSWDKDYWITQEKLDSGKAVSVMEYICRPMRSARGSGMTSRQYGDWFVENNYEREGLKRITSTIEELAEAYSKYQNN